MSETAANDKGPLSPAGVRALKIAIVVMGVMIVLGVLVIIGRIFYLAGRPSPQAASSATSVAPAGTLTVPSGASVRHVALSGDRLAVHYEGPAGAQIAIVDITTGAVLARYAVVPEAPR